MDRVTTAYSFGKPNAKTPQRKEIIIIITGPFRTGTGTGTGTPAGVTVCAKVEREVHIPSGLKLGAGLS